MLSERSFVASRLGDSDNVLVALAKMSFFSEGLAPVSVFPMYFYTLSS
jgi:hypothetical protein